MTQNRIHNFSAGPATLPLDVLQTAQREFLSMGGTGMSVVEISHRSKLYDQIYEEAVANIRHLLNIPDAYHVLFIQGGASLQFSMIPMNFLRGTDRPADYVLTGAWANKAVAEAWREGSAQVAWDGKSDRFTRVPRQGELTLSDNPVYLHYTSNETIQGVEYHTLPDAGDIPLVCDVSSDFLSRPIDISRHAILYAGAQKNIGPAGATVVILRDSWLKHIPDGLPTMLDYRTHAAKKSAYNTPPVFVIYMIMLVTRWLREEIGGLEKMHAINQQKAQAIYDAIDQSDGYYRPHAVRDSRSLMNVTWRLPNEALEQQFIAQAEAQGISGLKGHRSVGGLRASIYNAMPMAGVEALVDFMQRFKTQANSQDA